MTNDDDERVRAEPEQAPATQALPQWVPFRVAAVWLSSRDYSFANAVADQNSLRIELALSTANWTKYSHTEAAELSIERFRAAYPIPIEDEQLTWSLWLALPPDKREVEIQAAERYGADLKHISIRMPLIAGLKSQ
jgi:hypothetical protein